MIYPLQTKTITLYTPVKDMRGNEITSLSMREPQVRDRLKFSYIDGPDEQRDLAIIADLCNQPVEVLHELTIADYKQLEDQFIVFMVPPGRREALEKKMKSPNETSSEQ